MDNFETRTSQFVMAMVLACRGEDKARLDVSQIVGQMMQDEATQPLGNSLMQIIIGVRDREKITAQLEGEPLRLVNLILDELNT